MRKVYRTKFLATSESEVSSTILCKAVSLPEAGADDAARTQLFIISTGDVDNQGDVLSPTGWDIKDFLGNPIILFDHDQTLPIGRALDTYLAPPETTGKGYLLKSLGWFPTKDVNEFSDNIYKMIRAKVLTRASVGFIPLEFTFAKDRQLGPFLSPINCSKQKLLEWSVVSVPANAAACAVDKSFDIDWKNYHTWLEKALDEKKSITPRKQLENTFTVTKSLLSPDRKTNEENMKVKAGRVLSADNVKHLQDAMDHHQKAMACMKDMHKSMKNVMANHFGSDDDGDDDGDSDTAAPKKKDEATNVNGAAATSATPASTSATNPSASQDSVSSGVKSNDDLLLEEIRAVLSGEKTESEYFTTEQIEEAVKTVSQEAFSAEQRRLRGQE